MRLRCFSEVHFRIWGSKLSDSVFKLSNILRIVLVSCKINVYKVFITMSRIIRVLIQNSLHQNINRERTKTSTIERSGIYLISLLVNSSLFLFWCKEFWINRLIILLIFYILGKSKHLIIIINRLHANCSTDC